ncbi:rhodanese-like domain-containing protein [Pontibacter oryzae]|uniref:Rhodanese-like domain-containing protein n=1 Tax=Pontibacter oryzae TaxID=2304593 RepID=A0A399RSZ7_9BACT|nr:rhodanese-like domain-containing protein [Pontibacter oryzae]RIJ34208.1 rhodanese-like domain-containing protein [Pontibacter oryzae]
MQRNTLFLGIVMLFASCNSATDTNTEATDSAITQSEIGQAAAVQSVGSHIAKSLLAQQPEIIVLDVRTPEEFEAGHLEKAQLLNIYDQSFEQRLQELDKTKTYLVYCAVGGRSNQAVQAMNKMGFNKVYDATEGFMALKSAGVPVK